MNGDAAAPPATTTTTTTTTTSCRKKKVAFVITGFGPFSGVSSNPTTTIVHRLQQLRREWLEQPGFVDDASTGQATRLRGHDLGVETELPSVDFDWESVVASLHQAVVMETSTVAVRQEVTALFGSLAALPNVIPVVLHLGVAATALHFRLERFAYNVADFRVPDVLGHQPRHECVVGTQGDEPTTEKETHAYGHLLETTLDLSRIQGEVVRSWRQARQVVIGRTTENGHSSDKDTPASVVLDVSSDAGRYVCNYTYYTSLEKATQQQQDEEQVEEDNNNTTTASPHVLFFHVPPFSREPEHVQVRVVLMVMHAIQRQLLNAESK